MAHSSFTWTLIGLTLLCATSESGFYIPKQEYIFYVSDNLKSGDLIGTIQLSQHNVITCDDPDLDITTTKPEEISVVFERSRLHIRVMSRDDSFVVKDTITFEVELRCEASPPLKTYYAPLTRSRVQIVNDPAPIDLTLPKGAADGAQKNDQTESLCPPNESLVYRIIENTETSVIDVFGDLRIRGISPGGLVLSSQRDDYLYLNSTTGELKLLKSPNREEVEKFSHVISCSVKDHNIHNYRTITVAVWDVDDSPPYSEFNKEVQIKLHTAKNKQLDLLTFDRDSFNVTNKTYSISTNDTLGIVSINTTTFHPSRRGSLIKTVVYIQESSLSDAYIVDVVLTDVRYESSDVTKQDRKRQAIHRIEVPVNQSHTTYKVAKPTTVALSLDVSAAKYSLVTQLGDGGNRSGQNKTSFQIVGIIPPSLVDMLAVTQEGDVYVDDPDKLFNYKALSPITVTVVRKVDLSEVESFPLSINVVNNLQAMSKNQCDRGCSLSDTEEKCRSSCGYGAGTGLCSWRTGELTMSENYSTCSPNFETCPDGECSDLERLNDMNCPQDCSLEPVVGQGMKHDNNPRGIKRAKGPCWCERENGKTTCWCLPPHSTSNSSQQASRVPNHSRGGTADPYINKDFESETCSPSCRAAITGSITAAVVVLVLVLLGWMVWRRRRRRQEVATLKHVSSLVSMNAVPSDYIVDDSRDLRGHVSRQTSSPASVHWMGKPGFGHDMQIDDKWEFPRRYLTLEHVIGEGEFGQVVKAQAFMLRGLEGNTVVAVKMLKPDASGAEYQDLVSEIHLLKEVSHPNVIQLLGVCTQKGPLYAIVEYCELGSLRNFLRSSKFKNKGNWDSRQRGGNDVESLSENTEVRILTCRDLFSFAWQIAKGMDYLASLKIVHRDLAARNVLVTDGLKMKISDFGLSRDVYEADTYLKMSKGRIPVKWMAPESLYAQIYTTKSDIWSYGIVLWEIVTLGASPYPGIPPERLFPLLSTGYRMDRPDDCPEELYAIMQKCWKAEPENRPPFSVLRDILDNLLQQNTEYLDLSYDNYLLQGSSSDIEDKHTDPQPTTQATPTKPQYSNVCSINHCPPNVYVSTQWEGDELDGEECPEMCKLLGDSETVEAQVDSVMHPDIITEKSRDGRKNVDRVFVHENLTYV